MFTLLYCCLIKPFNKTPKRISFLKLTQQRSLNSGDGTATKNKKGEDSLFVVINNPRRCLKVAINYFYEARLQEPQTETGIRWI